MVHVRFSRWMLALLAILLIGPWLTLAWLALGTPYDPRKAAPADNEPPSSGPFVVGRPGPWGELACRPFRIELPDEFVFLPPPGPVRWYFKGSTREQAIELLQSAGFSQGQLDTLQRAGWKAESGSAVAEPDDDLVLAMAPEVRAKLYSKLVEIPENSRLLSPIWFRPGQVEERLKESGLAESSLRLLQRLLYPHGEDLLVFADLEPALRRLGDETERRRFVKAVSRKKTLLARLKVDAGSDVDHLAAYWSVGGRRKDVSPLLDSLRREGEGMLSIVPLLPPFMRERLYTHPSTSADPAAVKQDSCWSAMNVFNDKPDDRFADMDYVRQVLARDYYHILSPSQLGDLVFLTTQNETVVHAAAYVADDVYFTKNGRECTQPWILMHLDDMVDTHAVRYPASGPLKLLYFRRKAG